MTARAAIENHLREWFPGVRKNTVTCVAAGVPEALDKAGYVIVPKWLVERALDEGENYAWAAGGDRWTGLPPSSAIEELKAMLTASQSEG